MTHYNVIIIGAGAAGMMCAIQAGQRGRQVLLVDHAKKIGEKIRIAGGGRCNFTNLHTRPEAFLSSNPHFCKSALKQYSQDNFIAMVERHGIAYHEKTLGQLFCDDKSQQIIDMLLSECDQAGVDLRIQTPVQNIRKKSSGGFVMDVDDEEHSCDSLVIATGGLSIPKIGATKFGYEVARQFNIPVHATIPALVPLTFQAKLLERCRELSGLSVEAVVKCGKTSFAEGLLFTHRGLSGPSILQISSYWREGQDIEIDLAPGTNVFDQLKTLKTQTPKQEIHNALATILPARLAQSICEDQNVSGKICELSEKSLSRLGDAVNHWRIRPSGTEGYRTAEVTLCGVDTNALSSKTMEAKDHPGLYFIGEVVDVTGHLGGYNFQWAWSSGYVAGQHV